MDIIIIGFLFAIAVGIQIIMFVPAFFLRTDAFTDISYAITFVMLAFTAMFVGGFSVVSLTLFTVILLWAVRLGTYLLIRIRRIGKDARFDGMREDPVSFLRFWLLQGLSVFVILLPAIFFLVRGETVFHPLFIVGICIALFGIVFESIADYQKFTFLNDHRNKDKWIATGVWKLSRHPNYVGEIMMWVGIYVAVVMYLPILFAGIGLLGPLYIIVLLRYGSGVPLLEKSADAKWGNDPAYIRYKQKTPVLFPNIFWWKN
jgi:steroid 5-alpha reductase family enzyme